MPPKSRSAESKAEPERCPKCGMFFFGMDADDMIRHLRGCYPDALVDLAIEVTEGVGDE